MYAFLIGLLEVRKDFGGPQSFESVKFLRSTWI